MTLGPGSIAFVGFNADGTDGFAFVVLDEIPAGTTLYFRDDEWNGSAFTTGEGILAWSASSSVPAGTLVEITSSSADTPQVSCGTIERVGTGQLNLGASNEVLYAYLGNDAASPSTFLTAFANSGFSSSNGSLDNTGLSAGTNAIDFSSKDAGVDVAAYDPALGGPTFSNQDNALAAIHTLDHWRAQDASNDQDADDTPPDAPFLSATASPLQGYTAFTLGMEGGTIEPLTPGGMLFFPNAATSSDASDASTSIALDDDWMVVGDDEANVLRIYPRAGGPAVAEWSFAEWIGPDEADLEASTRIGQTLYFVGSHSNASNGDAAPERSILFSVAVSGTGADTTFTQEASTTGLKAALLAWDTQNGHGKGANYYGLAASSADGVSPEAVGGFSIEGLTASLDDSSLLLGLRAPQVSPGARTDALLVPVSLESLFGDTPSFGAPIELDLGGRGIRSIERADDSSGYLILAGPAGAASPQVERDFRLYHWSGNAEEPAVELDIALDHLAEPTSGSFEAIVAVPSLLEGGSSIQLLLDNGDTVWPGQSQASKKLPPADQRFEGVTVTLDGPYQDTAPPELLEHGLIRGRVGEPAAIVLTFDEGIRLGVEAALSLLDEQGKSVSFSTDLAYNQITLTPTDAAAGSGALTLALSEGAITDHAGNALPETEIAIPAPPEYPLLITEINSNAPGGDFFEITNLGDQSLDLTGWRWDDDSADPNAGSVPFPEITLAPGERLLVAADTTDASALRQAWGLAPEVPILALGGPGLGKDDAIFLFDAQGNLAAALNYGTDSVAGLAPFLRPDGNASSGGHAGAAGGAAATASLVWDETSSLDDPRYVAAVSGRHGAYAQSASTDAVGSPAIVALHSVQGAGSASPLQSRTVTVDGVITAVMPDLSGFFLQEQSCDVDDNHLTSEGIFVYYGDQAPTEPLEPGLHVRLTAKVSEYRGLTELQSLSALTVVAQDAPLPDPAELILPALELAQWEAAEGMLVRVRSATDGGSLVVTDNYNLGRYGQVTLTSDAPLLQYTQQHAPDVQGYAAYADAIVLDQILLDDGSSRQNPSQVLGRDAAALSAENTLRVGDATASVLGVLDQFIAGSEQAYETTYRIQPTETPNFAGSQRPGPEALAAVRDANLTVASANVLNYFNTIGSNATFTTPYGTPYDNRGADSPEAFQRQRDKIVAMLQGLDADVVGLMEIQNNGFDEDSALADLVAALNAVVGEGTYGYIHAPFSQGGTVTAPTAGDDAIMVALLYKPSVLTPVGPAAVPDPQTYPAFSATHGNRVPLAQTFRMNDGNETFTVVVNHLKSKGSVIDPDQGDGQGANNLARLEGVDALTAWLATDPTGSGDPDFLLLGDFNAYTREDPIVALEEAGFRRIDVPGHSYAFDGMLGSLDHAFATTKLYERLVGATEWDINASEPVVLDYNLESYYAPTPYRASDHDPLLLGFTLQSSDTPTPTPTPEPEPKPTPAPELEPTPAPAPAPEPTPVPEPEPVIVDIVPNIPGLPQAPPVKLTLAPAMTSTGDATPPGPRITDFTHLDAPSLIPPGLELPLGMIRFGAELSAAEPVAALTLLVSSGVPINGYWKQDADGNWVDLTRPEQGGKAILLPDGSIRLDFAIQDGGRFDADGARDGRILDLGAPAYFPVLGPDGDGDGIPDAHESELGLRADVRDNDVFSNDELFVRQLYRDLLVREADTDGLAYWRDELSSGRLDRPEVIEAFLSAPEYRSTFDEPLRLFIALSDTAPPQRHLVETWRILGSEEPILDTLLKAIVPAEIRAADPGYIDWIYENVLDRTADPEGRAYWLDRLKDESQMNVLRQFLLSPEFQENHGDELMITQTYLHLLHRAPDPEGYVYWRDELSSGRLDYSEVVESFLAAPEYQERFLLLEPSPEVTLLAQANAEPQLL